ncbi:hypothetical protein KIPB_012792, partial [Kipferlia bialata]|eukprot:g12792.t1
MGENMRLKTRPVLVSRKPNGHSTCTLIGPRQVLVLGETTGVATPCAIVTVLPSGEVETEPVECPLPIGVHFHSACLIGKYVYIYGGRFVFGFHDDGSASYRKSPDLWRFHIRRRSWQQQDGGGSEVPWPKAMYGHTSTNIDERLFVAGSWERGGRDCSIYNPIARSWEQKPRACEKVCLAGSVVVDGVLHCFGGWGGAGPSALWSSCNLSDFSWTKHPDMPFTADSPAVWSLPPYIVVCGGSGHKETHALHLGSGEWEHWGHALGGAGERVAACPLDSATTFIHSRSGSYIVTSETMVRRERDNRKRAEREAKREAERERVAAFNAAVSLAADGKISEEIERLAPRVESTLHHLRAVIPTPDTDMSAGT